MVESLHEVACSLLLPDEAEDGDRLRSVEEVLEAHGAVRLGALPDRVLVGEVAEGGGGGAAEIMSDGVEGGG